MAKRFCYDKGNRARNKAPEERKTEIVKRDNVRIPQAVIACPIYKRGSVHSVLEILFKYKGRCYESIKNIARDIMRTEKTARDTLKLLVNEGYVISEPRKRLDGGDMTTLYTVVDIPEIWTETDREKRLIMAQKFKEDLKPPKKGHEKRACKNRTAPASDYCEDLNARFSKKVEGDNYALHRQDITNSDCVQVENSKKDKDIPCYTVTFSDIQDQIETNIILSDNAEDTRIADTVQVITEVIADTLNAGKDVYIDKKRIAFQRVRDEYRRLTMFEIQWILDKLKTYHPYNLRHCLRSMLYNARIDCETDTQRRYQEDIETGRLDYYRDTGPGIAPAFG